MPAAEGSKALWLERAMIAAVAPAASEVSRDDAKRLTAEVPAAV